MQTLKETLKTVTGTTIKSSMSARTHGKSVLLDVSKVLGPELQTVQVGNICNTSTETQNVQFEQ